MARKENYFVAMGIKDPSRPLLFLFDIGRNRFSFRSFYLFLLVIFPRFLSHDFFSRFLFPLFLHFLFTFSRFSISLFLRAMIFFTFSFLSLSICMFKHSALVSLHYPNPKNQVRYRAGIATPAYTRMPPSGATPIPN